MKSAWRCDTQKPSARRAALLRNCSERVLRTTLRGDRGCKRLLVESHAPPRDVRVVHFVRHAEVVKRREQVLSERRPPGRIGIRDSADRARANHRRRSAPASRSIPRETSDESEQSTFGTRQRRRDGTRPPRRSRTRPARSAPAAPAGSGSGSRRRRPPRPGPSPGQSNGPLGPQAARDGTCRVPGSRISSRWATKRTRLNSGWSVSKAASHVFPSPVAMTTRPAWLPAARVASEGLKSLPLNVIGLDRAASGARNRIRRLHDWRLSGPSRPVAIDPFGVEFLCRRVLEQHLERGHGFSVSATAVERRHDPVVPLHSARQRRRAQIRAADECRPSVCDGEDVRFGMKRTDGRHSIGGRRYRFPFRTPGVRRFRRDREGA